MKNEANHSDMLDIMKVQQGYLGEHSPIREKVLSGGDQLTWRHVMDGNTPKERLQVLEPVCEDWHALMCFMHLCVDVTPFTNGIKRKCYYIGDKQTQVQCICTILDPILHIQTHTLYLQVIWK